MCNMKKCLMQFNQKQDMEIFEFFMRVTCSKIDSFKEEKDMVDSAVITRKYRITFEEKFWWFECRYVDVKPTLLKIQIPYLIVVKSSKS